MSKITSKLKKFYQPAGPERVGYVLLDGSIVEVQNQSAEPDRAFDVSGEDLLKYAMTASATWHTHPGAAANLSMDDFRAFKNYPKLTHYIVGDDGVRAFKVEAGQVMNA